MKKFLFVLFAVVGMLFSQAAADEGYWPKSYFAEVGFGIIASKGDFNERSTAITDTAGKKGLIHQPALDFLATPDLTIGANIAQFTLALNFQYWTSNQTLAGFSDESYTADSRIWRLGFEFTYNLFWPDYFQIGLGGGYSYTSINTKNSVYFQDGGIQSSELMGSAVGFIANLHYYFTDRLSMVPAIKVYENWFKNAYSGRTDNCDLDPYLWQTFVLASVSLQYTF